MCNSIRWGLCRLLFQSKNGSVHISKTLKLNIVDEYCKCNSFLFLIFNFYTSSHFFLKKKKQISLRSQSVRLKTHRQRGTLFKYTIVAYFCVVYKFLCWQGAAFSIIIIPISIFKLTH